MSQETRCSKKGPVWLVLLGLVSIFLLTSCGYHQPAPVEERSTVPHKRKLNSDGTYSVRSGDTLYAIAFHYGMDPQDIAKWNDISSPYLIHPGQKIWTLEPPAGSRISEPSSGVQISKAKTPGQVTTKPLDSPTQLPRAKPSQATSSNTAKTAPPVKTPVRIEQDPKSWKWPTDGSVLRAYVANDPARNGLDIAGKEGQAIITSAAGHVVYSGNGLIGYGELIIVKHSEKMLSAYAHNKVRLVKEGEQVSSGQKIAEMGRNASHEQILHFEIRVRGKPVNPLIYLPKK